MRPNHNRGGLASKIKSFSRAVIVASGLAGILSGSGCVIHTTPSEIAQAIFNPFDTLGKPGQMARQRENRRSNEPHGKAYQETELYNEPRFFVCGTVKDSDKDGKLDESDFIDKKSVFGFNEPIIAVAGFPKRYSGKIVGGKIILVSDERFIDSLPEGRISEENEFTWKYTSFTINQPWWANYNTSCSVEYAVDWSLDGQFFKRYTFVVKK